MVCYSDETLYAPSHSLSSLHFRSFSRGFMSESPIHIAWLVTHILRSLFERHQGSTLVEGLTIEVQTLQAELHRSQRVLAGYGELLQRCEANHRWQAWGNSVFCCILVVFAAISVHTWWVYRPRAPLVRSPPIGGSTGGSSDSEDNTTIAVPGPNLTTLGGPLRPSQLGKGRKRA